MHGITGNNPANDPDKKPVNSHSKFQPNMSHFYTALFGQLAPSYAAEIVQADKNFSVRCQSEIDTFTLKAPLMTPVRHNKAYFFVPMRAILPETADLIVTNPTTGEDVDPLKVNCLMGRTQLMAKIAQVIATLNTVIQNVDSSNPPVPGAGSYTHADVIGAILSSYQLLRNFCSDASLLNRMGISTFGYFQGPFSWKKGRYLTFDEIYEYFFDWIRVHFDSFQVNFLSVTVNPNVHDYTVAPTLATDTSVTYKVDLTQENPSGYTSVGGTIQHCSLRQLLELMHDNIITKVDNAVLNANSQSLTPWVPCPQECNDLKDGNDYAFSCSQASVTGKVSGAIPAKMEYINISRIVAYQMACVEFFTNDSVDFVYNCHLWHDNQKALVHFAGNSIWQYTLNGLGLDYDSVSEKFLDDMVSRCFDSYTRQDTTNHVMGWYGTYGTLQNNRLFAFMYLCNIFAPNRSLKYRDYFVGAKVRPMAVGNVDVQINNNVANVVDITKNIQMQRFLNQVNRLGRSLKEYTRGIFGVTPMPDPHVPIFIGSTQETIGATETENTAEAQYSQVGITSKFRNESSRFAFDFSANEAGWVIAITFFDVVRPYTDTTDKATFHYDRFDMFNPYMQHIGDQEVSGMEVCPTQCENFGYQLRYSEYKQRTDRASGGFRSFLPGYAFLNDRAALAKPGSTKIQLTPNFIRARAFEFDQFYLALTNFSDAGYFHFIVRDDYQVNALRPMEAAPSIL